jgi:hypothetical protein
MIRKALIAHFDQYGPATLLGFNPQSKTLKVIRDKNGKFEKVFVK